MWCPKPKPKVIARPKLILRQFPPGKSPEPAADNDSQPKLILRQFPPGKSPEPAADNDSQEQHDPHRHRRHYGMKHSDVTRIFLVEDRNCHVPGDQPYGLKKTDITRYLERVIPSHAFQASNTNNAPSQTTSRDNNSRTQPCKKGTRGDSGGAYPTRPPSRCETRQRSRREASRENSRPETAPTGEMKRLSATNACKEHFPDKPALADSGRRAMASSPLKPIEEPKVPSPGKLGSKPGTAQTSKSWGAESGFKDFSVGCPTGPPGSRSLTASTSHTCASRLQPVPE